MLSSSYRLIWLKILVKLGNLHYASGTQEHSQEVSVIVQLHVQIIETVIGCNTMYIYL